MTLNLQDIDCIPQQRQLIVYGYIDDIESKCDLFEIPLEIKYICILFYGDGINDKWDTKYISDSIYKSFYTK